MNTPKEAPFKTRMKPIILTYLATEDIEAFVTTTPDQSLMTKRFDKHLAVLLNVSDQALSNSLTHAGQHSRIWS